MSGRFGVGRVLGTSCRIWARNFPRLVAITALLYLPVVAWVVARRRGVLEEWFERFDDVLGMLPLLLREVANGVLVVHAVTMAAVTHAVFVAMAGKPVPIGRSLRTAVRRFLPVMGVMLVVYLATWGIVRVMLETMSVSWSLVIVYGALGVYAVLSSLFYLAVPVATAERRGLVGSIVRSFRLTRGARFRVLAIVVVERVGLGGCYLLLQRAVFPALVERAGGYGDAMAVYSYVAMGLDVLTFPLIAAFAAVTYRLLREDKEGLAAEDLAKVFE